MNGDSDSETNSPTSSGGSSVSFADILNGINKARKPVQSIYDSLMNDPMHQNIMNSLFHPQGTAQPQQVNQAPLTDFQWPAAAPEGQDPDQSNAKKNDNLSKGVGLAMLFA